jgi:hypothetical protein
LVFFPPSVPNHLRPLTMLKAALLLLACACAANALRVEHFTNTLANLKKDLPEGGTLWAVSLGESGENRETSLQMTGALPRVSRVFR